jgi:hypothetical protein
MREWLPAALGVAVSPLPAAAMLLLLGGARAVRKGTAFWLAWVAGVAVQAAAFVLLADRLEGNEAAVRTIAVGELAVGLVLVAIALRQGLGRKPGPAEVPGWLQALDRAGPARAAGLALVLSLLNPKNLALVLSGSLALAEGADGDGELALSTAGFVLVAASTATLLLLCRVLLPQRSERPLGRLRAFVAAHDRRIALVLGLLIGAYFVLDGLRRL